MFNTIRNPKTGKLVKSGGNVGKQLIKNPGTHVYNPITGKNVKVDGRVGKMVMGGYRNAVMYGGLEGQDIEPKEVHDYRNGNYKNVASLVEAFKNNKPREIQFILDYFKETKRTENYADLFELYNLLIKHKPSTNDAYFDFLHKLDEYYKDKFSKFSEFQQLLKDQDTAYKNNYIENKNTVYNLLIKYKTILNQQEFTTCKTESKRQTNPCRNSIKKGFYIPTIENNLWISLARMIGPYIESIRWINNELNKEDSLKHLIIPIHTIPTNDSKPIIATKFIQPIEAKIEYEKKKKIQMFEILNKWAGYNKDAMTEVLVEKNLLIKQLIKNQLDIIKDIDTTLNKVNNNWLIKQIQNDHTRLQKERTKSFLEELKQGIKKSIISDIISEFIGIKKLIISSQYIHNQEKQSKLLVQLIEELFEVIKVIDTTLNELKQGIKDSIKSNIIPTFQGIADQLHKNALKFKTEHKLELYDILKLKTNPLRSFRGVPPSIVSKQIILNPYVITVRELFKPENIFLEKEYYIIKTLS